MNTTNQKYFSTSELCDLLNICPRTLARYRSARSIAFVRLRGKFLYPSVAVDKFLAARTVQAL